MKKRKILVLIPMVGLFLSGCSFSEGFAKAKHWVADNIYHPAKDWIDEKTGKKEEKKPTPEPAPAGDVAVTGVTVTPATLNLTTESADQTLTATVAPSDATNKSVTWSVEPAGVVTVSETGVVHVVAAGDAVVTATSVADTTKKATCAVKVTEPGPGPGPTENDGTAEHPYTVAEARAAATAEAKEDTYVKGIVYKVESYNDTYKSITYWISDDGVGSASSKDGLKIYGGLGMEDAPFESVDSLSIADEVVIKGSLMIYQETTYELDKNSVLISRTVPTVSKVTVSGTAETTAYAVGQEYSHAGLVATATFSNKVEADVSKAATWEITPKTATADDDGKEISVVATYREMPSAAFKFIVSVSTTVDPTWHAATIAKGSTQSVDTNTINGLYTIKMGKSNAGGNMTITVGANSTKVRFYAVAWNKKGGEEYPVAITGATADPASFDPVACSDVAGTATSFTIDDVSPYLVEINLTDITAETVLTLTSTERVLVFGAEYFA